MSISNKVSIAGFNSKKRRESNELAAVLIDGVVVHVSAQLRAQLHGRRARAQHHIHARKTRQNVRRKIVNCKDSRRKPQKHEKWRCKRSSSVFPNDIKRKPPRSVCRQTQQAREISPSFYALARLRRVTTGGLFCVWVCVLSSVSTSVITHLMQE